MAESASTLIPAAAASGDLPARDAAKPAQANPFGKKKGEPTAEELLANINRALPFSDEAEKSVLSSLLQDPNERLSESRVNLPIAAFYHEANRTIYEKLLEFYDKNIPIDPVMVTNVLRDQNMLDRVGGPAAITELFTFVPSPAHYLHYKKIVLDKYLLRQLIHACSINIHTAYEFGKEQIDGDVGTLVDQAEQRMLAVRESTGKEDNMKSLSSHVAEAIDSIQYMLEHPGQLRGLSTGYSVLDKLSSGLQGSEMFVIAARPSMGKTSFAMNLIEHISVDCNHAAAVFSLEMSATMLVRRLLVSRAQLSMQDLSRGLLSRAQQEALAKATRDLQKAQIFIDDTPGLDVLEMRAKARRLKKQHNIQVIMIDYLQLVTSSSRRAKDNRQIEIAEISAGIKGIAKELNIPVIVLAQLNRAVEGRKGQRPVLSDLRESGSIEQDADMVGLLTREDYAGGKMEVGDEEEEARKKGQALLILAKNRNGPTDDVPLRFIDYAMRFVERSPEAEPDSP
ncbi:replicative DNA helicase [Brevifollis gellanilyticus]|uniref:Replicative DNA helicase n=1 Tax=Brevifollis gellanilyticus TaxID=748831 RepID=A0A512M7D3_9BACT|nr:replicative DNA helicase [Brevifollis gellanilyticus]GEP42647.1 replicative DNA helicase [Brevifollis gellanilyticus]